MQTSNFFGRLGGISGSRVPALALSVLILLSVPAGPRASWAQLANPEQEFIFAQKLYDDNLLKLAAEQFQEFVKKFPNDPRADSALFLSGESYFQLSEFKAAFDRYKELEISYPRSAHLAQGRFRMARCQEELGDFLSAASLYRSFQLSHPTEARAPEALLRAGKALLRAGRPNDALSAFHDVTRLYPDAPERLEAHLAIIEIHESAGRYDDALTEIDAVFRAFGPEPGDVRVYLLRAQILERMGEFDEAEKAYRQIILKYEGSEAAASALFRLGKLSQARGDLDAAGQFYDEFLNAAKAPELRAKGYLSRGDVFFQQKEFAQARESYKSAAAENVASLRQKIRARLASASLRLGDLETSIAQLSALVSEARLDSSATASDRRRVEQAYVDLVDALLQVGRGGDALQFIARYAQAFPEGERQADLAFRRARIFDESLHDYSRALRAYDEFQEKFSTSPLVDESQMKLARCYERLGEFSVALKEYARYEQRYPAGDEIEEVKLRRRLIAATVPLEPQSGIERIGKLLQTFGETDHPESRALEWGRLYFEVKDFVAAERQFKLILAQADTLNAALKQEAYFELGRTFFRLAQQAELQEKREKQSAFLDSARVSLAFVKDSLETPEIREEALWLLAQIDVSQEENAQASYERLLQSLKTWPQAFSPAKHLDYVLIHLARAAVLDTTRAHKKLREALAYCERLLNEYRESPFAAEASFRRAKAFYRLGQDSTALAALSGFVQAYPGSRFLPEALLLRARLLKRSGDWEGAARDLDTVRSRFFYSKFAAEAQRDLADLRYEQGDFQSAVYGYETYLKQHSAETGLGASQTGEIWFRLARAYENLHDARRGLAAYVRVIFQAKEQALVDEARLAVARIAQRRGETSFAKAYYTALLRHSAPPTLAYKAETALGDMLFEEESFSEARQHYLNAVHFAADADQARYPRFRSIRCKIKQGQFTAAAAEIKRFKKDYKDTDVEEAQFLLDKGDRHLANKDFELAEKAYKKLKSDYKRTEFGAKGEFGLGAVYLFTNHTEDALHVLTALPEKYPDSDVTPLTYFNLGDFYYKSHQIENAISAFKKVLQHPKAGEFYGKAMLYLTKCYHDLQLWDQAVALTRTYLQKFPHSPESFRQRIELGVYLLRLKEYGRAIAHFRELLPHADPESEAEIQFYIAQSYNEMGDFQHATAEYLKVKYLTKPTKLPWHVTALFEAAKCLVKLGDIPQARSIFQRIVDEQGSESNFGRFALKQLADLQESVDAHPEQPFN